jgi:carbon storage regulator CsrA
MVLVGDDIQIKVIDVRGERVRIGVTAPKGLPITRPALEPERSLSKSAANPGTSGQ